MDNLEEILQEAIRRYPKGCKVKSLAKNYLNQVMEVGENRKSSQSSSELYLQGKSLNPCVWSNGKWAEIVEYLKDYQIEYLWTN